MNDNYSLEEALTTPAKEDTQCKDHLGNVFKSKLEMSKYWGVNYATFISRMNNNNYSLEEALTTSHKNNNYKECIDPVTNKICTVNYLSKKYNIDESYLRYYIYKNGNSKILRALDISFTLKPNYNNFSNKTKYNLTVHKRIAKGKDVFECYIDNGDGTSTFRIMTYDMIDQYCLEQYKKNLESEAS